MFARVLIDLKIKDVNQLFDYIIPKEELDTLEVGMRVIVPFGEQVRLGYVIEITNESSFANREIIEVLDIKPTLTEEAFIYLNYLKNTNYRLLIELIQTITPKELFLKYEQKLTIVNNKKIPEEILVLFNNQKEVTYSNKTLKNYRNQLQKLINQKAIKVEKIITQKAQEKLVQTIIYLNDEHYKNKYKYEDLISFVKNNPNYTRKQLTDLGFNLSSINTLIKNNVFAIEYKQEIRNVKFQDTNKIPKHILNEEQQLAYNTIKDSLNKNKTFLLNGITGSGKTEVYMQVMNEVLKTNKNILYLVPEINLVAPLMQNLKSRFNIDITHYNSNLSQGERFDAWQKIINNEAKIIVGTRSSIFLPIENLGLIIMDEEHDKSYLQKEGVQYDTLEIAKLKSKYHNCPLILGSATPRVTSMYNALNKKYQLLNLSKRATNQSLPKVSFIDMKEELKNGNTKIFSQLLYEKINDRLQKNEQIILLFNRKGYASFMMCRICGHTPKCNHCDISLTYYKDDHELRCNYCGYKEKATTTCPSCNQKALLPIGIGIDQVVEIVKKTFKNARVVKMDADSTKRKNSHEQIWLDFQNHKYDILVGTQMVSKGLDFPKVTLVGVLMSDLELKAPTYLATEQAYSILTQMIGRSGRSMQGEAIVQGYDLNNYAIKNINKPYENFYKEAIYYREIAKYEPFYHVAQVLITNESYLKAYQDALKIQKELKEIYNIVLGPAESIIKYIKNEFRFILTIKNKNKIGNKVFEVLKKYDNNSKINYLHIPDLL